MTFGEFIDEILPEGRCKQITEKNIEEISLEQFGEWRNHPVTKAFYFKIKEQIKEIEENIKKGHTLKGDSNDMLRETSRWLGIIEGLEAVIKFQWKQ